MPSDLAVLVEARIASGEIELPVFPASAQEVLTLCDSPDVDARKLASVIQHEAPEPEGENGAAATAAVPLVIMTHRTTEGQLQQALAELGRLGSVRTPSICMPVSD